jgi:hypothetical protein
VELPDTGGEVRWFANAGARLLGVDVVDAAPSVSVGENIAQSIWAYNQGDRSLSGSQANLFSNLLSLVQAFVLGRVKISYPTSTMTQYNPNGTVLKVFDLEDENGNPAISAQTAVDRVPQP